MIRPFDLNLRHLRALSAIAGHGSMNAAARAVSLSQPALTQGLAKLERQLATPLFVRHPHGVRPTPAGSLMASRADAAFVHLAQARAALRRGARGFGQPEHLMTASQLHAFLAVADAGSFVGAASATGLSQPALHRAVRDLEQIGGTVLVERRGRGLVLSAAGRRLARGVRLAAGEIEAGLDELADRPGGEPRGGRIAIGAMPLSRALLLPAAIAAFISDAPRATIDVAEGSWRELVEPLRDGVIDLMIGALRDEPPEGLDQRALFVDPLIVVGRADHPLALVGRADHPLALVGRADRPVALVGPADHPLPVVGRTGDPAGASVARARDDWLTALAGYSWIVGQVGSPLRSVWEALFAGRDAVPRAPIACGSVMVIRGILRDSNLLTLLSPDQVALEVASGILTMIGPPLGEGTRAIGVTTRTGWRPTAAQTHFLTLLDAVAATIVARQGADAEAAGDRSGVPEIQ